MDQSHKRIFRKNTIDNTTQHNTTPKYKQFIKQQTIMNILLIISLLFNIMPQNKEKYTFSIKREYTYNNADTIKLVKSSYDINNKLLTKVVYQHDKNNNKIKTEKFINDSILIVKYNYIFDNNNFKIKSTKTDYRKNTINIKEYVNDKKGKVIRKKEFVEGKNTKNIFYTYTEKGNMSKLSTYDTEGDLISEISYEYDYDENGNIKEKRNFNSEKKLTKISKYTYNQKHQITNTYSHFISGRKKDSKRVYAYDEKGRKMGSTIYIKE